MKNLIKKITLMSALVISSIGSVTMANEYKNAIPVEKIVKQEIEGKILVQQFLWHKCIHCYKLEESIDKWVDTKPDFIEFERVPVIWSNAHEKDSRFYNYAKILEKNGKITQKDLGIINNDLFNIVFIKELELTSKNALPIFQKYGITKSDELEELVNSFAVSNEITKGKKLTNEYGISGVPMFVINGKFIVGFQTLKDGPVNPANLLKTIEEISTSEFEKVPKMSKIITPVVEEVKEISTDVKNAVVEKAKDVKEDSIDVKNAVVEKSKEVKKAVEEKVEEIKE